MDKFIDAPLYIPRSQQGKLKLCQALLFTNTPELYPRPESNELIHLYSSHNHGGVLKLGMKEAACENDLKQESKRGNRRAAKTPLYKVSTVTVLKTWFLYSDGLSCFRTGMATRAPFLYKMSTRIPGVRFGCSFDSRSKTVPEEQI